MLALATVEFELGRFDDVLRHVDEVAEAATAHGRIAGAFCRRRWRRWRGSASASAMRDSAVEASLAALRERDAKAHLAYALNEAAAQALGAGAAAGPPRLCGRGARRGAGGAPPERDRPRAGHHRRAAAAGAAAGGHARAAAP